MASVIDNNIVMWDVGESAVKVVCSAILDGKGKPFYIYLFKKRGFKIVYTKY